MCRREINRFTATTGRSYCLSSYYAFPMTATSLPARIGYANVVLPLGAVLGYALALKLLIKFGSIFEDPHSSMQGFGYFMMSLASAATFAATASLIALTLPWKRPIRANGKAALLSRWCFLGLLS